MSTIEETPVTIKKIEVFVFRAPIDHPVKTSFGVMKDRPAVFVRIEDFEGNFGWGEIWCNFPNVGAEHRARLVKNVLEPIITNLEIPNPRKCFEILTEKTAVLAIQSGEYGPLAQAISGIDLALWDLFSRRSNMPLWKYLGGSDPTINVYASGINPDNPEKLIEKYLNQGHKAFKLKVGFGSDIDISNLKKIRSLIPDEVLMVDANQAWELSAAIKNMNAMEGFGLRWIEEPLRADSPLAQWSELQKNTKAIIAAGENMTSRKQFEQAIDQKILGVLQPDIAKWGGISVCQPIIEEILKNNITYCPHYLGGGIGLLASAHLLAASHNKGYLEIDSNVNPLRTLTCGPVNIISDGKITLSNEIGIGIEPNLEILSSFKVNFA